MLNSKIAFPWCVHPWNFIWTTFVLFIYICKNFKTINFQLLLHGNLKYTWGLRFLLCTEFWNPWLEHIQLRSRLFQISPNTCYLLQGKKKSRKKLQKSKKLKTTLEESSYMVVTFLLLWWHNFCEKSHRKWPNFIIFQQGGHGLW